MDRMLVNGSQRNTRPVHITQKGQMLSTILFQINLNPCYYCRGRCCRCRHRYFIVVVTFAFLPKEAHNSAIFGTYARMCEIGVGSPGVHVGISNAPPVVHARPIIVAPQVVYQNPPPMVIHRHPRFYQGQPVVVMAPQPYYYAPSAWVPPGHRPGWRGRHDDRRDRWERRDDRRDRGFDHQDHR